MAWQKRGNHSYYYMWCKRKKGRKKVCFGRGPIAEIAARKHELDQAEKTAARAAVNALAKEVKNTNENLRELAVLVEQLVSAEMIAAGYHRIAYRRWRKRK